MCSKDASSGSPGDGDGSAQGTCADAGDVCLASGECKCQKTAGGIADDNGKTVTSDTTCSAGSCCCSTGECKTFADLDVTACTDANTISGSAYAGC